MSSDGPTSSDSPAPRRRWRPWRFSLSTLFVVFTVVGVWLGIVANRAERQRRALESLKSLGGTFGYRYDFHFGEAGDLLPDADSLHPPAPEWLRSRIGSDYFSDVYLVNFAGDGLDDDSASQLTSLPQLRWVILSKVPMGDVGLRHFAELEHLRRLSLLHVRISDEGLASLQELESLEVLSTIGCDRLTGAGFAYLSELPRLKELSTFGSPIENEAMRHIGEMESLEILYIWISQVDDDGLKPLSRLKRLRELDLSDSGVTGPGLRHLSGLASLRVVELRDSPLTDEGLIHLSKMKQLETLLLNRTEISDAGLLHLRGMTQLKHLDLSGSKRLSEDAVSDLKAALPNTKVDF